MTQAPVTPNPDHWRKCNSCKKPIAYKALYWVCNVSTCNRKRTGLVFCSISCWDAHVPMMNHRESWAEERRAPSLAEWEVQLQEEREGKPRTRRSHSETTPATPTAEEKPSGPPRVILRRKSD